MSTTHTPSDATALPPSPATTGERALELFEDLVWHNQHTCTNCFTSVRRSIVGTITGPDGKRKDVDETWRTDAATLGQDLEEPPESIATVQPLARPRTTCEACGSVGCQKAYDTLTKQEALDRVPELVARVGEQGYRVDRAVVYDTVRHLKSHPEYHGDDKHVFATAVALGVDRA